MLSFCTRGGVGARPTSRRGAAADPPRLRPPTAGDAAAVWRLVDGSDSLDVNSPYAYLLLCSHFADTSVVAELSGRVVGFVGAYRPPRRPDSVFVWQIVTAPEVRARGLGAALLAALIGRPACHDVRFVEATVTRSNGPSRALFAGFARRREVPLVERKGFGPELFPTRHEEEVLVRIGPLVSRTSPSEDP